MFGYLLAFHILSNFITYCFVNLPDNQLQYYFNNFPNAYNECQADNSCLQKVPTLNKSCWGYEDSCHKNNSYSKPRCYQSHQGWVNSKEEQIDTFYNQADFGYVRNVRNSLRIMCEPLFQDDASLECSENLQFCRARNIFINFTSLAHRKEPFRYKMDVLSDNDIGGFCRFHKERLLKQTDHMSPLQSWSPELQHFTELTKKPELKLHCDIIEEKPTFILKIDATVNLYHHTCDFFNLYTSLHVNASHPQTFSQDINLLIWETYPYRSSFADMFHAFTSNPIQTLSDVQGKVVCYRNVVFPLLPRMIFGLFYNTPVIYGCEASGLFHSYSEFILHRLNIHLHVRSDRRLRITFLSRETKYRNVLNEAELITALNEVPHYNVSRIVFNRDVSYRQQLEVIRNTDILIGMHGAGLTHLLYLPDWAAIFEIYNCEDPSCYLDLSRLRGIKYATWQDKSKLHQEDDGHHPSGGGHAKFTNYAFDKDMFLNIVKELAEHVSNHNKFKMLVANVNDISHDEL